MEYLQYFVRDRETLTIVFGFIGLFILAAYINYRGKRNK
jgi:hypothetical protein